MFEPGSFFEAAQFARLDEVSRPLPDMPTANPPALLMGRDDGFIDRTAQHHLDDFQPSRASVTRQAVDERALNAQAVEQSRRSGGPAAVNNDRV